MIRSLVVDFRSILIVLIILTYSCKDEEVTVSPQKGYLNYFPLKPGHWIEYESDSVVHLDTDDALEVDTAIRIYKFQIREVIDSSFIDGENQQAFLILRYRRNNDSLPWTFMNTWTAKINPYSAQRVEDNIRFIRLEFPITRYASWNGNAYNFFPEEEYTYEDLYEPLQFGNLTFDSTITVLQNDFVSLINRIQKKEIYAANTGLIFKQIDSVNTTSTPNGIIILNGLEYKLTVIAYNQ